MSTRTPEAQCLGRRIDHVLAIRPYAGDEAEALLAESVRWRKPAFTALVLGVDPPWTADIAPMIALGAGPISVSACKRSHDGARIVLRLHNGFPTVQRTRLSLNGVASVVPLGLDEEPRGEERAVIDDVSIEVEVPGYGLTTLGLVRR
jgi:alpha-mannosidase